MYGIEFRKDLLIKGWLPLPAFGKAVTIPGWSSQTITGAWLDQFDPKYYPSVGLRCDNLIAFDLDSDDTNLVQIMLKAFPHKGKLVPLLRQRDKSARVLVVYRIGNDFDKPPVYRKSRKYQDGMSKTHQWEILSGPGHQFIGFGRRSVDDSTGRTLGAYRWHKELAPNKVEVDDVCPLSVAEYEQLVNDLTKIIDAYCNRENMKAILPRGVEGEFAQRFNLRWDMKFSVTGGSWQDAPTGLMRLDDAFKILEPMDTSAFLTCHLDGVRPTSDSGAGRIRKDREGDHDLLVTDFAHKIIWRMADQSPPESQFGKRIWIPDTFESGPVAPPKPPKVEGGEGEDNGGDGGSVPRGGRAQLNPNEWVFVASENAAFRISDPVKAVPIGGFRNLYGSDKVNRWLKSRQHAEHLIFDPEGRSGLLQRGSQNLFNQYITPKWGSIPRKGGETDTFHDFLHRLVPDDRERKLVLEWIALKVTCPWLRLHGLVMVAPKQGTGRGTLVHEILAPLIGEPYLNVVSVEMLLGRTYQAQYTDYLSRSLIVYVEEARDSAGDRANDWNKRKQAYEKLKEIVDPSSKRMHIVRKSSQNTQEQVYASVVISTNHIDALAIEAGDRRFIVVNNGAPLYSDPAFAEKLHAWYKVPENMAALYWQLKTIVSAGIDYDPFALAPETAGKTAMVEANRSSVEEAALLFIEALKARGHAVFTADTMLVFMSSMMEDNDSSPDTIKRVGAKVLRAAQLADQLRRDGRGVRLRVVKGQPAQRIYVLCEEAGKWARADDSLIRKACHDTAIGLSETQPATVYKLNP